MNFDQAVIGEFNGQDILARVYGFSCQKGNPQSIRFQTMEIWLRGEEQMTLLCSAKGDMEDTTWKPARQGYFGSPPSLIREWLQEMALKAEEVEAGTAKSMHDKLSGR